MSLTFGANSGSVLNFERVHTMWLKLVLLPDPLHRCRADLLNCRHRPETPAGGIFGSRPHGPLHNRGFLLLGNLPGAPAARPIFQNAFYADTLITPAPLTALLAKMLTACAQERGWRSHRPHR